MNVGIVGCGYVAAYYANTFSNHSDLRVVGAWDVNSDNLQKFAAYAKVKPYADCSSLLGDRNIELLLNLTNPRSHFSVTRSCLEAGKHVYSEKPLGMTLADAHALAALAREKSLYLGCAPCSVLSDAAQTLWKAVREQVVGRIRVVYANFDDGLSLPRMAPWQWKNDAGVPWPAKDEFEVGCTYEHAGYLLTWLATMFGPASKVTSFATCVTGDKGIAVDSMAPDLSVGCIEYASGVVARVTCGLSTPRDKSLTLIGDEGVLFVGNVRDDYAPVMVRKARMTVWQQRIARATMPMHRWLEGRLAWPGPEALFQSRYKPLQKRSGKVAAPGKPVDFMRGPAEIASAITSGRPSRLSPEMAVHIVELVEALQSSRGIRRMETTFDAPEPLGWATS